MIVLRIALIGIAGVVFANYFKSIKSEYGMLIGLFVSILIFYYIMVKIAGLMDMMQEAGKMFESGFDFMEILIKMLGISYICELSAGICKDAGYHSVATQIVIFGKITIMTLGSSILFSLIKIINTYLG
ncbi:MAG: SpoIIIAC/SpoIIIAD family protein [Thermoflexaceae bacterium]|nr:SpoIIIAC/SpoIIIAD family protein [Thermoflexaceae bacterium]